MKIVEYRSSNDIDIEFLDCHHYIKPNMLYSNFKLGNIKNPYDKTALGIGYIGVGEYKTGITNRHTDDYQCWYKMINRCYNPQIKEKYCAYYGIVTVTEEWLCFQNFAKWYNDHKYECEGRLHLDKDILIPGNKMYSPDRCLLVPQRINMLFLNKPNNNDLPNGIRKVKNGYKAIYNKEMHGVYATLEDAYFHYAEAKENTIKNIAEEYKDIIPKMVYEALLRYKVNINNDKNYIA